MKKISLNSTEIGPIVRGETRPPPSDTFLVTRRSWRKTTPHASRILDPKKNYEKKPGNLYLKFEVEEKKPVCFGLEMMIEKN
ncbi:hypothetical protein GE061_008648 [Apolygus lucorum]|uniref:Uncharacterized protein n=1 Tax=Apolygus lucorum TaxID=248454 RepID=A0A8S9WKU1_APOLU|nr:hypothetical protein GE061_008648 [Apolygus lucorum]